MRGSEISRPICTAVLIGYSALAAEEAWKYHLGQNNYSLDAFSGGDFLELIYNFSKNEFLAGSWTYRAPYHIQTPQSWTPCLLISALYSVCWREGKRREERVEGKKEERREREEEGERTREIECAKLHHTHAPPQHHTTHQTTDRDLESVFVKRKSECSDMCSPVNRP